MKLSIGISPCPNDLFIFEALINQRIPTQGIEFDWVIEDVESLNQRALQNQLDVSKLSYHTYMYVMEHYQLLQAGGALGRGCGPLLIAKHNLTEAEIEELTIAIPGKYTTANLLLQLAYPSNLRTAECVFSEIEEKILADEVGAGVIIHENRFTYQDKGLTCLQDLGSWWEDETDLPIPLGGIVARKELEQSQVVDQLIEQSVTFAFDNPEVSMPLVRQYAQEMDEQVMRQHIRLYVNDFSVRLGKIGNAAVKELVDRWKTSQSHS